MLGDDAEISFQSSYKCKRSQLQADEDPKQENMYRTIRCIIRFIVRLHSFHPIQIQDIIPTRIKTAKCEQGFQNRIQGS